MRLRNAASCGAALERGLPVKIDKKNPAIFDRLLGFWF
jgi:hypothetical protein